jgi:hypothetical protein
VADWHRNEADRLITQAPKLPRRPTEIGGAPKAPTPDPQAQALRKWSKYAIVAVAAAILAWTVGAASYDGTRGPGALWVVIVVVLIACGITVWVWISSISDGRAGQARELAARSLYVQEVAEHNRRRSEYTRQESDWRRADEAARGILGEAQKLYNEHNAACVELEAIARHLNLTASALAESDSMATLRQFRSQEFEPLV